MYIFRVLNYLRGVKLQEIATGGVDNITLFMQLAFLYAIDISLVHREDGEGKVFVLCYL